MICTFKVPGDPFGKQRPRHTKSGHTYTPEETRRHELAVGWAYRQQCGAMRFAPEDQIEISVVAFYAIPKRATKAQREKMLCGEVRPTVKPDWDNIGKLICDALNGVAYDDDKCVVQATVSKWYSDDPSVVVTLKRTVVR